MKIQYANKSVEQLWMGDLTKCVYQFLYNEKDSVYTEIIQYFIIHGLGLCIKLISYVAHVLYTWSFIHNTAVPIAIKKKKYFLSLNTHTTVFAWVSGDSNTN